MNNMDFFLSGSIYIEVSLKPSLCSAQDLWATGNMDIREKIFKFSVLSKPDWPGVCNNYDPASVTIMTRCHPYLQTGNFGNIKPASFTSLNQLNIRWVFQDQYFLSRCFGSRLKWIILHNISLWETNIGKLSMKLAYWPGFSRRSKWQGLKNDQVPVYKNI